MDQLRMPNRGRRWRWCAKGGAVVIANNKINPNINPKEFCQFKQRLHSFARCGTVKAKAQFDKELRAFKVVAWESASNLHIQLHYWRFEELGRSVWGCEVAR